jgi:hypothetical protein
MIQGCRILPVAPSINILNSRTISRHVSTCGGFLFCFRASAGVVGVPARLLDPDLTIGLLARYSQCSPFVCESLLNDPQRRGERLIRLTLHVVFTSLV